MGFFGDEICLRKQTRNGTNEEVLNLPVEGSQNRAILLVSPGHRASHPLRREGQLPSLANGLNEISDRDKPHSLGHDRGRDLTLEAVTSPPLGHQVDGP